MADNRRALGIWGENAAAGYLEQLGYQILERNFRTPYGEIDIVCRQAEVIVFVEVKTRSSTTYGLPEESVTRRKQARMVACAQAYLQAHPGLDGDWRLDVVAVQRSSDGRLPMITHFENAIC
jgi:putative endonuclease